MARYSGGGGGIAPVDDHKVDVTVSDTTPNYLASKLVAGAGIALAVLNPGANETLQVTNTIAADDHKVAVSVADTTPGFLSSKVVAGAGIALTILNPGANETLSASISGANLTNLTQFGASPSVNQFLKGNGTGVANSWATLSSSPANPGDNNKLTIALNGDFTYAFLADVNVATNAAIGVSKLAPSGTNGQALITTGGVAAWGTDFGAQNLVTTGNITINNSSAFLQIGVAPVASTGFIRLPTAGSIVARNSANTFDVPLIAQGPTSDLTIGSNANIVNCVIACTSTIKLRITNLVAATITSGGFTLFGTANTIQFDPAVTTPKINQTDSTTGSGATLQINAQGTNVASATGGLLLLGGGDSTNGTPGVRNGIRMRLGVATANTTMLELVEVAVGRRVLGLISFGNITTTQMPANTGDGVAFLGNAATNPTANPTLGLILYANTTFSVRDANGNCSFGDGSIPIIENGSTWTAKTAGTTRFSANGTGIGLYATAPIAQAARVGQLTDSTTGTPSTTLVDVGVAFSQANINNNFSSVLTKINAIETAIHNIGLTA